MSMTSCEKFLNVIPKSSIAEDDLFSSEAGYAQALVGIYSAMATRPLYGDKLSMGFLSVMAQNYNSSTLGFIYKESAALNFESQEVKNISEGIWSTSFNAIAGLNNIITHIEKDQSMFTGNNYALIKGEAQGLRAFLHFDLLRLYASNPVLDPDGKFLPYRTEMNANGKQLERNQDFIKLVIADLDEADKLLSSVDPILSGNRDRRFKMNALAIKAMLARVNLYAGHKAEAKKYAQEVIDSKQLKFVTNEQISRSSNKDRLFSDEQIFTLKVRNMANWIDSGTDAYFKYDANIAYNRLTRSRANFQTLYDVSMGGATDYRYVYLIENDGAAVYPSKYWGQQMVPMLRYSELYYILAETAASVAEGIGYINTVRDHRGLATINPALATEASLANDIRKEYQKEFYAEGQVFFYYKRTNSVDMLFNPKALNQKSYILPIPDSETEFNNQY